MHIHRIVIAAVALSLNAATAFATPLTGSYSISEQYSPSNGGPGITNNLASPFNINLVAGTETSPANFFTTAPHGNCSGGGCSNHIETDTLTVTFSNLEIFSGLPSQRSWKPRFLRPNTAEASSLAQSATANLLLPARRTVSCGMAPQAPITALSRCSNLLALSIPLWRGIFWNCSCTMRRIGTSLLGLVSSS